MHFGGGKKVDKSLCSRPLIFGKTDAAVLLHKVK